MTRLKRNNIIKTNKDRQNVFIVFFGNVFSENIINKSMKNKDGNETLFWFNVSISTGVDICKKIFELIFFGE